MKEGREGRGGEGGEMKEGVFLVMTCFMITGILKGSERERP
jgi:hypothetical protein